VVRVTGQHLVLLLWTVWLVVALVSVGGRPGGVLLLVVGGLGLGLVLTGLVSWRAFLIAALAVHVLAAASRALSQLTAVQPSAPAVGRPPLELTAAVQPGPHAPVASARHRSLGALPAFVPRWPLQVLAGSVSLAGVIWLLILRPAVPWLYRADIPIMIGTVALLVAAEYGCWRFYKHLDRRLTETMKQLQEERQQRRDSDTRNHERSEWLEKRLQLTESDLSQRRDELSQAQADFRRAQDGLRHAQDRLGHAQEELRHMQAELRREQSDLRQGQRQPRPAPGEQSPTSDEQPTTPDEQPPAPDEQPQAPDEQLPAPGERPQAQDTSALPQGDQGDAPAGPVAERERVQRLAEREAAARKAAELVSRAREAAQQTAERESAVRKREEPVTRPREAPQQEAAAERAAAERQAQLAAERAEAVKRTARVLRGPSDPPGRHGPAAGPGISPVR
jgi:hypothetical protein